MTRVICMRCGHDDGAHAAAAFDSCAPEVYAGCLAPMISGGETICPVRQCPCTLSSADVRASQALKEASHG